MGGSEPGIDAAPSDAGLRRRRLRAAVAGSVTSVVIVTGGLFAIADRGPAADVAASPSRSASPGPSASPTERPSRLGPPTHLRVERGVTSVGLAWDPPTGGGGADVHHYEVFRDGKRVARPTRPKYVVTGLTFGTRYRFWVVAVGEDDRVSPRILRSVSTKVPPVSAARLSGTFTVAAALTASNGERARFSSHSITWSLLPSCADDACDVSFTATHRFGSGSVVTSGVLDWSGTGSYEGTWVGSFGTTCRDDRLEAVSTLTITMRATSAHVVGGLWVASDITGSIHERVRGCGGAPTATYDF